jgi:hypothetical protein
MAPRLKILMASRYKKGNQIYTSLKSPGKRTPSRFPNRAPMKREAHLEGILHITQKPYLLGFPVKEPSLKVPFMESLAERCPTTRALHHSSIKVPGIRAPLPHTRFPSDGKGPQWREMPVSRNFLNISFRVSSEGAPPLRPLAQSLFRRDASSTEPPSSLKVPGRWALLQVSQTGPLWKEMLVSRAISTYLPGSPVMKSPLQVPLRESERERETLHP